MTVLGIRLNLMEAKRGAGKVTPQIKVNSVPKITGLKETNMPMFDKKALAVDFDFLTEYTPDIGTITISGEVFYVAKDNKEALSKWETDKQLPEGMRIEILNHLFRACLLKAAILADDLQLPAPMAIPRVKAKEQGK